MEHGSPVTSLFRLKPLRQFADFGFEGGVVAAGVGEDGAEASVELDRAGLLNDLGNVGSGDAGPGKDEDAVSRGGDEFGEFCGSLQSGFCASRSENSCG